MSEEPDEYWTPRKVAALGRAIKRLKAQQPAAIEMLMKDRGFTEGEAKAYLAGFEEGRGK